MKKSLRKLQLSRETVRNLNNGALGQAKGATGGLTTSYYCDQPSCDNCEDSQGCVLDSWQRTCTCW